MSPDASAALSRPLVLAVDDDETVLAMLGRVARREGYQVLTCSDVRQALAELRRTHADLILVDLSMPGVGGLPVIRALRTIDPHGPIVVISREAAIDPALDAIRLGARDYLINPFDLHRLRDLFAGLRHEVERRRDQFAAESTLAQRFECCGMIGRSPVMQELFDLLHRLARHVRTALVIGEAGTEKALVAQALHTLGPRRDRPFITVDSQTVASPSFARELFGYARTGASGATGDHPGLLELADGGTLFVDEVGRLAPSVQVGLLRAIELGEILRVGAKEVRRVDVRVIGATGCDPAGAARQGRLRTDLFDRLNRVGIRVPALRDRKEDLPYLTAAFVRECGNRVGKSFIGVTPAGERLLFSDPWTGNIAELRRVIAQACRRATGALITEHDLDDGARPRVVPVAADQPARSLDAVERDYMLRTLQQAGGNKTAAARLLGLSRRAFYRRLARHGL